MMIRGGGDAVLPLSPDFEDKRSCHNTTPFNGHFSTMTSVDLHQMDSPGDQDDQNHLSEHETVWRLLSHDAFAPAEAIAFPEREPLPHIAAYKISTALRSGIDFPLFQPSVASYV
jgi:hypothetical protein